MNVKIKVEFEDGEVNDAATFIETMVTSLKDAGLQVEQSGNTLVVTEPDVV